MSLCCRNFASFLSHRHAFDRLHYSSVLPRESRQKWGLSGLPRPLSILDDDSPVDLTEDGENSRDVRPNTSLLRRPPAKPTPHEYKAHREVMQRDFPGGWNPPRKVSREAMEGIRQMHRMDPRTFSTPTLAEKFKISPEAVRRILKSRWEPPREKRVKLVEKEREERNTFLKSKRDQERAEACEIAKVKRVRQDEFTFQ